MAPESPPGEASEGPDAVEQLQRAILTLIGTARVALDALEALVADTFFEAGEWVNAGQPVVALLAPGAVRARFFVPEAELGALAIGQAVQLRCDGCTAPAAARIDFIASRAEYTPPVIYSNAQRARLVFMVEARPETKEDARHLKPGQPVDVRPLAGAGR